MRVPPNDRGDTNGRDEAHLKRLAHLRVLETVSDDGNRTLVLSGELDIASSWLLDCPLLKISTDGTRSFTLDLSRLTFIDSTGKGLCAACSCEIMLIPGPARVQRVFEVSGLMDHLPFRNRGASAVAEP